jgi:2-oxoglutarate ferredoxin oxidoreductase subunit beta
MHHPDGIELPEPIKSTFKNQIEHDPADLNKARELADQSEVVFPIGLFYRNPLAERYDNLTVHGMGMSPSEKTAAVEKALDQFTV